MRSVICVLAILTSIGAGIEANTSLPGLLLCPPCPSQNVKCYSTGYNCYYKDVLTGRPIIVDYLDTGSLFINCNGQDVSVDNLGLPKAQKLIEFKKVTIISCKVPKNGSYYDALNAMNFTMSINSELDLQLPANPQLGSHHLCDLTISVLHIKAVHENDPPRLASDYLKYVSGLRSLKLEGVIPEVGDSLPLTLENLHLERTHLAEWMKGCAWLERLQNLSVFYLLEDMNSNKVPFALPKLYLLPKLKSVTLQEVLLDRISLSGSLNGSSVDELVLDSCELDSISSEMFVGANLTELQLINSKLTLPKGIISGLEWLKKLDVSNCNLDRDALLGLVSPLKQLEILYAKNNPLGSLCGGKGDNLKSGLPKSLQKVDLSNTNATRICPDWIYNEALMHIELSNNNIVNLTLSQLTMKRNAPGNVELFLIGNPKLRMTGVSSADVQQFVNDTSYSMDVSGNLTRAQVNIKLDNLDCDCDTRYWLPKAISSPLLKIEYFKGCNSDASDSASITSLTDSPEENLCQYSGVCLPNCSCWRRPSDNSVVVQCGTFPSDQWLSSKAYVDKMVLYVAPMTRGVLSAMPRLPLVELYVPNNNITRLDHEDIPRSLRVLDVRNNSIQHISEAAAQKLKGNEANITLAGNPLACDCSDASAFDLLQFMVHDWSETQCVDHILVTEKMKYGLCSYPTLLVLISAFCLVLIMVILGFMLETFKPQIRKVLFKLNLCRRYIFKVDDKADSNKTVDVFLSYAHPDLSILNELRTGLECRRYTTLDHCRDWLPSHLIPEQIDRSVMCARRTILLVTDNFANSKWAVMEFHTAHAHAMKHQTARVLIVRCNLNEPNKLPTDLQTYLKYNTYLDWHDEKFWSKLCQFMPMQRFEFGRQSILPGRNPK